MKITYQDYLNLNEILSLQKPLTPDFHDEFLFVITHQVCELWFKQLIKEVKVVNKSFSVNNFYEIINTLNRIKLIIKNINIQFEVLETLGPLSFSVFRKNLGTTSGFQSLQFREIEKLFGVKRVYSKVNGCPFHLDESINMIKNNKEETLWACFRNFCHFNIKEIDFLHKEHVKKESIWIYIYKNPSILTIITDLILDIDKEFQEWRYKHLKLVERILGSETQGTGGSGGVRYLKKTLYKSFCSELLEARKDFYENKK